MLSELNRTLNKIKGFLSIAISILGTFFLIYFWPTLRIMYDGLKSGQLRGYVSIKSINNGFVSWYPGGPPFNPYSYALLNLVFPTLAIIVFLVSLAKILFTTSSFKRINLHTLKYYILCLLLSVYVLSPYFLGHPQIITKHAIEQSPNSSLPDALVLNARPHRDALLFRNGSDSELERGIGYFGINLTGTKVSLTYSDALRIIADGTQVQAKLRFVNSTNIANLNLLQIQFENDESSKIVISKGDITVKEGSFFLIPADTKAHLVITQEVETLGESSLVFVEISFSPENWNSGIILIRVT